MDNNEEILFQIQRVFAATGRNVLNILEDLKSNHDNNFNKLYANLPTELHTAVDLANYFDENRAAWVRKRILDVIMQSKRDLENIINE